MEKAKKTVTPASFVCEKCKGIPSMDQIVKSASTYGLIWLNDKKHTWLGFNCPLCEKPWTNIKKFKNEDINPFKLELEKTIADTGGILVYRSFPFSVHHPIEEERESPWMRELELYVKQVLKEEDVDIYLAGDVDVDLTEDVDVDLASEDWTDYIRNNYCSYFYESKALSPAIAIWWYKDEDIEKLASFESESGLRVFPRYQLYDRVCLEADQFCWQERLHADYENKSNIAFQDLLGEIEPDDIIAHMISNSTKRDLTKTLNFMHLLDRCFKHIGDNNVSDEIWDNFIKDDVQDLLKMLSEKFIDEYIALSKRIDFTFSAIYDLAKKYMAELGVAINSPLERRKSIQGASETRRPRVREAEKSFSGVEIISQHIDIDLWKLWISNLSKVPTDRKSFLLLGKLGTGKGLFAKAIHEASGRKGKFIKIDCGDREDTLFKSELFGHVKGAFTNAISNRKGALEEAENGTIFIDEIGNLSMSLQAAMLGFLQDWEFQPMGSSVAKPVKAMVVLATNKDLKAEIEKGNFRKDLYSRINSNLFKIPPLNSRKNDIPILFHHFIKEHDIKRKKDPSLDEFTATSACIKALTDFDWDEDVRQLEKLVENIIMTRSMDDYRSPIDVNDLPDWFSSRSKSSDDQILPESNQPEHPVERKYYHLPEDSVLIELKKQGMKNREIAERFKVAPETVSRRLSKIAKSQN